MANWKPWTIAKSALIGAGIDSAHPDSVETRANFALRTAKALACAATAIAFVVPMQPANADVLMVAARGRIDPVCEIGVSAPAATADFATSGEVRGGALVNCNTGFAIKATSANGAVKNAASASPGFTNSLNYRFSLIVPLSDAPGSRINATCGSETLVAGQSSCALSPAGPGLQSGGAVAINQKAAVYFSWKIPARLHLVAGSYQDVITISIAAAP
jgi:hypothetical protein